MTLEVLLSYTFCLRLSRFGGAGSRWWARDTRSAEGTMAAILICLFSRLRVCSYGDQLHQLRVRSRLTIDSDRIPEHGIEEIANALAVVRSTDRLGQDV